MRAFLRWMKNKALQEDSTSFNEAFAAMDEAFGPEVWRLKPGTRL
jgi:predicted aminopeptidase